MIWAPGERDTHTMARYRPESRIDEAAATAGPQPALSVCVADESADGATHRSASAAPDAV